MMKKWIMMKQFGTYSGPTLMLFIASKYRKKQPREWVKPEVRKETTFGGFPSRFGQHMNGHDSIYRTNLRESMGQKLNVSLLILFMEENNKKYQILDTIFSSILKVQCMIFLIYSFLIKGSDFSPTYNIFFANFPNRY